MEQSIAQKLEWNIDELKEMKICPFNQNHLVHCASYEKHIAKCQRKFFGVKKSRRCLKKRNTDFFYAKCLTNPIQLDDVSCVSRVEASKPDYKRRPKSHKVNRNCPPSMVKHFFIAQMQKMLIEELFAQIKQC